MNRSTVSSRRAAGPLPDRRRRRPRAPRSPTARRSPRCPTTISSPGVYCLTGNLTLGSIGRRHPHPRNEGRGARPQRALPHGAGQRNGGPDRGRESRDACATARSWRSGAPRTCCRTPTTRRIEDLHVVGDGRTARPSSPRAWADVIQRNWIERGNPVIRTYGTAVAHHRQRHLSNPTSGIDIGRLPPSRSRTTACTANGPATGTFGIRTASGRAILSRNNVSGFSICFDMGANTRYRENVTNGCTNTYTGGVSAGSNY